MLRVKDLESGYGPLQVLWDVSLTLEEGEIVSLIGANGAGKSTLLNTISGLLRCSRGEILFHNKDITRMDPFKIVSLGISQVPEGRCLFHSMNVFENLELGAYGFYHKEGAKRIHQDMTSVFEVFPVLKNRRKQRVSTLSGGEQQMVAIGRALMSRPQTLMLDEPSQGLAPLLVTMIFKVISELKERGISILLVEQNAAASLAISDRGYVLEMGRVVLSGPANALIENQEIKSAYLGSVKK
jgi:branched-chain amino acid transport system ATP-binding protein